MGVVIMGCGRVGAALAEKLDSAGYDVAIIDRDPDAFDRLPSGFTGCTITGTGFDRDVLVSAGIRKATAFAAVSSGDNSNIIAARVARESFGVERVIARIYDAGRAEVYERLGISTVATVPWTTARLVEYIAAGPSPVVWRDQTDSVSLLAVTATQAWIGIPVDTLARTVGGRVVALTRFGECRLPDPGVLVQASDLLHLALPSSAVARLGELLAEGPSDA